MLWNGNSTFPNRIHTFDEDAEWFAECFDVLMWVHWTWSLIKTATMHEQRGACSNRHTITTVDTRNSTEVNRRAPSSFLNSTSPPHTHTQTINNGFDLKSNEKTSFCCCCCGHPMHFTLDDDGSKFNLHSSIWCFHEFVCRSFFFLCLLFTRCLSAYARTFIFIWQTSRIVWLRTTLRCMIRCVATESWRSAIVGLDTRETRATNVRETHWEENFYRLWIESIGFVLHLLWPCSLLGSLHSFAFDAAWLLH